nr:carbohydrate sulfotransferase 11-like [Penaeus vannamei]
MFQKIPHPLTRLVSCYQDKFRNGSNFPERKKKVLEEFLFPALLSNGLVFKSQHSTAWKNFLDKTKRSVTTLNAKDKRLRSSVTFTEFLNHVVHTFEEGRINRHWRTYGLLCSPCFFDYEYIVKTETQDQDLVYLFSRFGFPSDPHQAVKVREDINRKTENDLRKGKLSLASLLLLTSLKPYFKPRLFTFSTSDTTQISLHMNVYILFNSSAARVPHDPSKGLHC